ncbi:MAG: hypothetical protein O3A30_03925 [Bacteroidetes bacterium]|nr:hypothetical protein [Bacteroidota bacterium]
MPNHNRYPGESTQELFALEMTNFKSQGHYVEVGAYHSREQSNTYFLENTYGWVGVSFEIKEERRSEFNSARRNPCFGDALKFNYISYFEENNFPKQIDFLQIDIDTGYDYARRPRGNPLNCLHGLISLPLSSYRFSVICFEHDWIKYFRNQVMRDIQREILDSFGYVLAVRDVGEDYWIDPNVIDWQKCEQYVSREYLRRFYEPKQQW